MCNVPMIQSFLLSLRNFLTPIPTLVERTIAAPIKLNVLGVSWSIVTLKENVRVGLWIDRI